MTLIIVFLVSPCIGKSKAGLQMRSESPSSPSFRHRCQNIFLKWARNSSTLPVLCGTATALRRQPGHAVTPGVRQPHVSSEPAAFQPRGTARTGTARQGTQGQGARCQPSAPDTAPPPCPPRWATAGTAGGRTRAASDKSAKGSLVCFEQILGDESCGTALKVFSIQCKYWVLYTQK